MVGEYEDSLRLDYLKRLNERYEGWIDNYKSNLLVVNIDDINYIDSQEDLGEVINKVQAELHGLF